MRGSQGRTLIARSTAAGIAATMMLFSGGAAAAKDPGELRQQIRRRARSQVGAPYSYGGSSPSGFDCSGFTRWVFQRYGVKLPHSSLRQYQLGERSGNRRIRKRKNLRVGDLVFHKTTSAKVGHVGIYIGKGRFISSTSSSGVRVRDLYDPYYWGSRFVAGVRLRLTRW